MLTKHGLLVRQHIKRLMMKQLAFIAIVSCIALLLKANLLARSLAVGGVIWLLPNLYFAVRVFRHSGARAAKQILRDFYSGEMVKLVLATVLFGLSFKYAAVNPPWVIGMFILLQVRFWWLWHKQPMIEDKA